MDLRGKKLTKNEEKPSSPCLNSIFRMIPGNPKIQFQLQWRAPTDSILKVEKFVQEWKFPLFPKSVCWIYLKGGYDSRNRIVGQKDEICCVVVSVCDLRKL